jgi:hypothetical protein
MDLSIGFFYFIRFINIKKATPGIPNIKDNISDGRFIPTYIPVIFPVNAIIKYPKKPKKDDEIKEENRRFDFINPYIKMMADIIAKPIKTAKLIFIFTP